MSASILQMDGSSSNFVAIARLVVLARKDPRTTRPFSSLLDLHVASLINIQVLILNIRLFLKKEINTPSRISALL